MSEPKVTDLFRVECSDRFGISQQEALDVVANPDQTAVLEQDWLTLHIHSKFIDRMRPPCFLIVIEHIHDDGSIIHHALRAYPDLCDGFSDLAPNDMLEAMAERFGSTIQVGAFTGKFIWGATIPIDSPRDITVVAGKMPFTHSRTQRMYTKIDKGPPMTAQCALAYCLNTDAYLAWLNTHG